MFDTPPAVPPLRRVTGPDYTPAGVKLPIPAAWAPVIIQFDSDLEDAGVPASSRRTYRDVLAQLARFAVDGPFAQNRASLREFVAAHKHWSNSRRRSVRGALVRFYDWAVEEDHVEHNPARQLTTTKPTPPRPRPAPEDAYQRALVAAAPRERLMLRLAYELGMRRDEVSHAHTDDLWDALDGSGALMISVHGKGSKTREQAVPDSLAAMLRALPHGYFFPGKRNGHLSAEYVGRRIALLLPGIYHMHNLRHSYGTRLYAACGDLLTVQDALGHASPDTTRTYVAADNTRRLRELNNQLAGPRAVAG